MRCSLSLSCKSHLIIIIIVVGTRRRSTFAREVSLSCVSRVTRSCVSYLSFVCLFVCVSKEAASSASCSGEHKCAQLSSRARAHRKAIRASEANDKLARGATLTPPISWALNSTHSRQVRAFVCCRRSRALRSVVSAPKLTPPSRCYNRCTRSTSARIFTGGRRAHNCTRARTHTNKHNVCVCVNLSAFVQNQICCTSARAHGEQTH